MRKQTGGKQVLVTGCAGFIGYHLTARLLADGHDVVGLDNMNDYYDVTLKHARLEQLRTGAGQARFTFHAVSLEDGAAVDRMFREQSMGTVVHLAAQAGVRHSLQEPRAYIDSNIVGFLHILESCRQYGIEHLIYASSSSVYGANAKMPYSERDAANHPLNLYAATKKSNELMAHSYSHLYGLPTTGLRFFTVYGPWGRPDMALYRFTERILRGEPIEVYNEGRLRRDFTYIDDIIEGMVRLLYRPARPNPEWKGEHPDPGSSAAPYRIYNIGNNSPVELSEFIAAIEEATGRQARQVLLPHQPGDALATYADVSDLMQEVGFHPRTSIRDGVEQFVKWYSDYHHLTP